MPLKGIEVNFRAVGLDDGELDDIQKLIVADHAVECQLVLQREVSCVLVPKGRGLEGRARLPENAGQQRPLGRVFSS